MSNTLSATPRLKSIQRVALVLLVTGGVINYIDRATLAVANPLIRNDLGLSIADMGYLLSAFLWAYAFAQLPTGAMVDKLGPRLLLGRALTLGSGEEVLAGLLGGLELGRLVGLAHRPDPDLRLARAGGHLWIREVCSAVGAHATGEGKRGRCGSLRGAAAAGGAAGRRGRSGRSAAGHRGADRGACQH